MNKPIIDNLTIQELQRLAGIGIEVAITELGRRVIDYDFNKEERELNDRILELEQQVEYLEYENYVLEEENYQLKCELGLV